MTYRRRGAQPVPLLTAGQASIRALLAGNPTRLQLMMRHTSVHRLCCDIAEHVRWAPPPPAAPPSAPPPQRGSKP